MRAFSLIEIMVAAAISVAVAAAAITTLSGAARKSRDNDELERLLGDVARERAVHVSSGRSEFLIACVDCVDDAGRKNGAPRTDTLDLYLADDAADRTHGRLVVTGRYELGIDAGCNGRIALDALGRSIDLGPGNGLPDRVDVVPVDCPLTLTPTASPPQRLVFAADGRLLPSFAAPLIPEPPHAQNLSSRTTPVPMSRGNFTGDATRAPALTLH